MARILVFTHTKSDLEDWKPWLEQDFEVTFITNENSLLPLLKSWQPQLLIYYGRKIQEALLKDVFSQTHHLHFGIITVVPSYDLRQELVAFHLGADHFILSSTPVESVRARIRSVIEKIERRMESQTAAPLISLPSPTKPIQYKNILLFPHQNVLKVNAQLVKVTPIQFRLLVAFCTHVDELLPREWLQKHVFGGKQMSTRSIDAQIAKLKKSVPMLKTEIVNVYGQGYLLKRPQSEVA